MRVATIGGATIDIIVSNSAISRGPGAKHDVDHIGIYAGGGAVNTSLCFAECGASVAVICAVGTDVEGQLLRGALVQSGIDVLGMEAIPGVPTGKAVVHIGPDGEAVVYAQRGASTQLALRNGLPALEAADLLYVSALAEIVTLALVSTLAANKSRAFKLALNPGASQITNCRTGLMPLLAMADLVCVNAIEAQLLARVSPDFLNKRLSPTQAQVLAPQIAQHAKQCVLITLGGQGAVFFDASQSLYFPVATAAVASTLGAGDTFGSTFAFHWASGRSPQDAMAAAALRATEVLGVVSANLAGQLGPTLMA